ncbi:MAG: site-specific integrase, partial [Tenericutes bacterium]|nr:site-specific integrase [Mycoplasmatota bacterium]
MSKEDFLKIDYVNDFFSYIHKKNYSSNTVISYTSDLYYFYLFINKSLLIATEDDIRLYLSNLKKSNEASTSIRRKISSFKSFYKFLYKNNYIEKESYPLVRIAYPKT